MSTRYVANSNGSHWLPSAEDRIEGMPSMLGAERVALSLRTRDTSTEIVHVDAP